MLNKRERIIFQLDNAHLNNDIKGMKSLEGELAKANKKLRNKKVSEDEIRLYYQKRAYPFHHHQIKN